MDATRQERRLRLALMIGAVVVAALTARPYAGSWNDGSRLATVESLVDRGTLVIDDSIFVKVPAASPSPYPAKDVLLQQFGTQDKLFIDGHFYSDKSPVPAFYLGGVYQTWRLAGGPSARERPRWFCRLMTWASSGLAFVVVVGCFFAMGRRVGLGACASSLLTIGFALGTVALPYAQHVNNHMLLLGVAAWVFLILLQGTQDGWTTGRLAGLGLLAGIGYTIDLAAGPMLCLAIGFVLLSPNRNRLWVVVLAALPWVVFHHVVNYRVGGTFGPANAVPAYLAWGGSPFSATNMTGDWNHASPGQALLYAADMLLGKKGFLGHSLLLFLPLVLAAALLLRKYRERVVVVAGLGWCAGTWLLYAATSNNLSGLCCSIRWFVPLLAPGFLAAALVLRDRPWLRTDALILGVGGVLMGIGMAYRGPWFGRVMPFYWTLYAGALAVWVGYRVILLRRLKESGAIFEEPASMSKAA